MCQLTYVRAIDVKPTCVRLINVSASSVKPLRPCKLVNHFMIHKELHLYVYVYLLPYILDQWISEYIWHDKKITNEYPNKFALSKMLEFFLQMNMFVQNIWIYSNIRLFAQDCFGLFWPFSYCVLFWTHNFGPIITILNHFWETLKIQIYLLS